MSEESSRFKPTLSNGRRETLVWAAAAAAASLIPVFSLQVYWSDGFPIHMPSDDNVLLWNIFRALIENHAVPFFHISLPRMAAPAPALDFSQGFPLTEQLQLIVAWLMARVVHDPIALSDYYYLLGYPLASLAFYFSALRLKMRAPIAFGLSVSFCYIAFHWNRYAHIFLSHYWIVAPTTAFLLIAWRWDFKSRREILALALASFVVTLWHVYFGYFFIGIYGCITVIRFATEKIEDKLVVLTLPFFGAIVAFAIAIGISTAGYAVARIGLGPSQKPVSMTRSSDETEYYSLRPAAVLLPVERHRIPFFAKLRKDYMSEFVSREGLNESIGTLGAIGFAVGIFGVLFAMFRRKKMDLVALGGAGSLSVFAFAGTHGVSDLISSSITATFRCPNRIGPYLSAFALFSLGLSISHWLKIKNAKNWIVTFIGLVLASVAVWDQVPGVDENSGGRDFLKATQSLVTEIDRQIPGGMVYQLPFVPFPEAGKIGRMGDYAHAIAPLYAEKTSYSYGKWRWTTPLADDLEISKEPMALEKIRAAGYSGIWVDRRGYRDKGVALENRLRSKLGYEPIQSSTGTHIFFRIK